MLGLDKLKSAAQGKALETVMRQFGVEDGATLKVLKVFAATDFQSGTLTTSETELRLATKADGHEMLISVSGPGALVLMEKLRA